MSEPAHRVFFALWPDQTTRAELQARQASLLPAQARAVPVRDLHLTLHFLGQVAESRLAELIGLGQSVNAPSFALRLDRLGHFAGPKVLWLGPSQLPEGLLALHAELQQGLHGLGFALESRPYRPHVTLARKQAQPLAGQGPEPVRWQVRQWGLLASNVGQQPLYRPLALWPTN